MDRVTAREATPAEKLLALCRGVEGLAGPHRGKCDIKLAHTTFDKQLLSCTCGQAERVKALKALAAALKVCVEGLKKERNQTCDSEDCQCCDIVRNNLTVVLERAARLASSEGEGNAE